MLKRFLDNKIIPLIPQFSTVMRLCPTSKKSQLFNSFFAKQCFLINNNCKFYKTEKRIHIFSIDEIGNIIQGLDPNKAHGQDKISFSMLKFYDNSICKSLEIIYQEYLSSGFISIGVEKGKHCPNSCKG